MAVQCSVCSIPELTFPDITLRQHQVCTDKEMLQLGHNGFEILDGFYLHPPDLPNVGLILKADRWKFGVGRCQALCPQAEHFDQLIMDPFTKSGYRQYFTLVRKPFPSEV